MGVFGILFLNVVQAEESSAPPVSPESETVSSSPKPSMKDLVPELDTGSGESPKNNDSLPEWTRQLPEESQSRPEVQPPVNPPAKKELQFTEEELEQIKKEKNWLVEEWKAHQEKRAQLEAELASEKEQSLIDDILKNYEEDVDAEVKGKASEASSDGLMSLAPALPPVSWGSDDRSGDNRTLNNSNDLETLFGNREESSLNGSTSINDTKDRSAGTADPSATAFISPQSPLLTEKKSPPRTQEMARLKLQPDSLPRDDFPSGLDPESFNPNEPFRPVVEAPGNTSQGETELIANGYLPPDQWPTWRQDPNQTESAADRIAWLQRQEMQRQEEENRRRPDLKDLDPLHRKFRSSSRFD